MQNAMSGLDTFFADQTISWQNLSHIQCLMPSDKTSQTINPASTGRLMSKSHWYSKIPQDAKIRLFNDAIPNPSITPLLFHPFAHAKALFLRPSDNNTTDAAILYVGSHNTSMAAWGVANKMPTNIEVGVVLSTIDKQLQQEWESRLPYLLPKQQLDPSSKYTPAFQKKSDWA